MFYKSSFLICSLLLLTCAGLAQDIELISKSTKVFRSNVKYEKGKRIKGTFQPSIVSTSKGTVHLFAQGRLYNSHDNTDKVIIYKSSKDLGDTWSDIRCLTKPGSFWGVASYVVKNEDKSESINLILAYSKVKLFELYNSNELLEHFGIVESDYGSEVASILIKMTSADDGETWKTGILNEDFLSQHNEQGHFVSFFTPVGQVNVVRNGKNKGRLMAGGALKYADQPISDPSDIYDYKTGSSAFIYSDDSGDTWHLSGIAPIGGNEASVAQTNGDTLLMIRRRNSINEIHKRIVNWSYDGGKSWTENELTDELPSPRCLGILYDNKGTFLYSSPRKKLRYSGWIGFSSDFGKSWHGRVLERSLFSYSDIERISGTDYYLVAYSRVHHGEFGIKVKRFHKDWLYQY